MPSPRKTWAFSSLAVLFAGSTLAATPPPPPPTPPPPSPEVTATLERVLKRALEANPNVQTQIETFNAADARYGQTQARFIPKLSSSASWIKSDRDVTDTFILRADQAIFAGGIEYSELTALRRLRDAEKERLEDAKDLARYEALSALLKGSLAQERVRILEATRNTQGKRFDELSRRNKLGQTREPDLIQAELEVQRLERLLVDARYNIEVARRDLATALQQDPAEIKFPELDPFVWQLRTEKLVTPREQYELGALENERLAAESRVSSAWRGYLPTVDAFATSSPWHEAGSEDAWTVGLKANWIFFDGLKTPRVVEENNTLLRRLQRRVDMLKFTREQTQARLQAQRVAIVDKLKDLHRMVDRAEAALKIQQADYRRGIVTELEVQTTIQSVLDLNLEQADLRYQAGQLRAEALKSGAALPERTL